MRILTLCEYTVNLEKPFDIIYEFLICAIMVSFVCAVLFYLIALFIAQILMVIVHVIDSFCIDHEEEDNVIDSSCVILEEEADKKVSNVCIPTIRCVREYENE